MIHVCAVVPVSPHDPESVITKSIECLKELECSNFTLDVYYVTETFPGDNRKLQLTLPNNFTIVFRNTNRGRRAGAINDFLKEVTNADYVAIIDVEHRPAKDYIVKCIAALKEKDAGVSSGCWHFVVNKTNILTKVIAIEHLFMIDVYQFLSHFEGFMTIQGTGVLKGSFVKDEHFNEEASLDDVDLTTRMYIKGKVAVLANTAMGDQAPTTLRDLYHQRVRWYRGMVESFSNYLTPMIKAPLPFARKLSWLLYVLSPFFAFFLAPIAVFYLRDIKKLSNSLLEFIKIFFCSIGYMWLMTAIGIVASIKHLTSKQFEWQSGSRADV